MPAAVVEPKLKLTEIFYSLQGETTTTGLPTTFIRLTGCPLRCDYCDTAYAFTGGQWYHLDDILKTVADYPARYVTVTGGEPLAQKACLPLLSALCDAGYRVSLETSGALPIEHVDPRVIKILDIKTPASKEAHRFLWENLDFLQPKDEVKFVICDRADYDWAKARLTEHRLAEQIETVLFSPSHAVLPARELADWILADGLPVRLQIQLHKLLWGDVEGK